MEELMSACQDDDWRSVEDFTLLCCACKNNLHELVELIIGESGDEGILNRGVHKPLWWAANGGHPKILEKLISYRDLIRVSEAVAPDGTDPIVVAALKLDFETLRALKSFYSKEQVYNRTIYFFNRASISLLPDQRHTF